VDRLHPFTRLSYHISPLGGKDRGLIINFNVALLRDGIFAESS